MKKISIVLASCTVLLLAGCTGISYGQKQFNASPAYEEKMAYDSARVKAAERAERAEYRRENREEMMDQADAIHRAYGTRTYNINKTIRRR